MHLQGFESITSLRLYIQEFRVLNMNKFLARPYTTQAQNINSLKDEMELVRCKSKHFDKSQLIKFK